MFAEWVGVEYTVAPLTQKDNICRPHLTCTNTHPHVERTGRKYSPTTQVGLLIHAGSFTSQHGRPLIFTSEGSAVPGNALNGATAV